jgi:hypothetical protein
MKEQKFWQMKWKRRAHLERKKMMLNDARKAIETQLH